MHLSHPPVSRAPVAHTEDSRTNDSRVPGARLEAAPPALSLTHVRVEFGGIVAVRDVSFDVPPGSTTAIIGPNGAGKSSILNCVVGVYRPSRGRISVAGADITEVPALRRHTYGIGRTFQTPALVGSLSAVDNAILGSYGQFHTVRSKLASIFRTPGFNRRHAQLREEAHVLFDRIGIGRFAERTVDSLPFGVRKKTEFARALFSHPTLLLADEPAAGLNETEALELADWMKQVAAGFGLTTVVVEHNMGLVGRIADRCIALDAGLVIATGTPAEVMNDPAVLTAYLGEEADSTRAAAGAPGSGASGDVVSRAGVSGGGMPC